LAGEPAFRRPVLPPLPFLAAQPIAEHQIPADLR
jgi:hypothetical protein